MHYYIKYEIVLVYKTNELSQWVTIVTYYYFIGLQSQCILMYYKYSIMSIKVMD